jgi:4'-phosphopantetheinyl transferase
MIELCWRYLDVGDDELAALGSLLSVEEGEKAGRFRHQVDRRRFVARRGMRRQVLAERVNGDPAALRFEVNQWGKPVLAGGGPISFNASHSGPVAVLALAAEGMAVGADVEVVRSCARDVDVAARFFSPVENAGLAGVAAEDFSRAFLRVWTRKEAVVKARGDGLSASLTSFDVTFGRDDARLERIDGEPEAPARWRLFDASGEYFGIEVVAAAACLGRDASESQSIDDKVRRYNVSPVERPAASSTSMIAWFSAGLYDRCRSRS